MIQFGESVNKKSGIHTFSEVARILDIKAGNKTIGRTKIMQILRTCNVLDKRNKPYFEFEDGGYFKSVVKKHAPGGRDKRRDAVTLVIGKKGLNFVRKIVTDFIEKQLIPFDQPHSRFVTDVDEPPTQNKDWSSFIQSSF